MTPHGRSSRRTPTATTSCYVAEPTIGRRRPGRAGARRLCDRHRGIGADGLILYTPTPRGASMQLLNADGSPSEVSGNGVRCLAALAARDARRGRAADAGIVIETDAGAKTLALLERATAARYTFRAAMGQPERDRAADDSTSAGETRGGRRRCASATRSASCSATLLDEARLHALGAGARACTRVSRGHQRRVRDGRSARIACGS